jgi:hypothetical protein
MALTASVIASRKPEIAHCGATHLKEEGAVLFCSMRSTDEGCGGTQDENECANSHVGSLGSKFALAVEPHLKNNSPMNPFLLAALIFGVSGLLAYGVFRALYPSALVLSRVTKGRQFAAALTSAIAFATLTRALIHWDDINQWVTVPMLCILAWPLGFLVGWLLGPKNLVEGGTNHSEQIAGRMHTPLTPTDLSRIASYSTATAGLPDRPPMAATPASPIEPAYAAAAQGPAFISSDPEERCWAQALQEFDGDSRKSGLWAKAYSDANGDEQHAKATYLKVRAEQLLMQHADAERAKRNAPVIERNQEIARCIGVLQLAGYKVATRSENLWEIREPLGGRQKIFGLTQLTEYSNGRQANRNLVEPRAAGQSQYSGPHDLKNEQTQNGQLARVVLSQDSLSHAVQLTEALGFKVDQAGGWLLSSPKFRVLAPSDSGAQVHHFDNWELFVKWVRREICPIVLTPK